MGGNFGHLRWKPPASLASIAADHFPPHANHLIFAPRGELHDLQLSLLLTLPMGN
jgi:hypothetical protein